MSTTSHQPPMPVRRAQQADPGMWGVAAVLLGLLVGILGFIALMMWSDATNARDDAHAVRMAVTHKAGSMPGMKSGRWSSANSSRWVPTRRRTRAMRRRIATSLARRSPSPESNSAPMPTFWEPCPGKRNATRAIAA